MRLLKLIYLNTTFYLLFAVLTVLGIPLLTLGVFVAALFHSRRWAMRRFRRAISWYGAVIIRVLPFVHACHPMVARLPHVLT